jgi:DNA invertase Pin-like site-specific DNA recombinase
MRVSTIDQNLDRQEQQLKDADCEKIFFEKVTGTKRNRPELNKLLEFLREGDTLFVMIIFHYLVKLRFVTRMLVLGLLH